jgi:hypothetical protein
LVDGGFFASAAGGRIGRGAKLPPQFGHTPPRRFSTQSRQKVHSKVQIIASGADGDRFLSQHSQLGRNSSIARSSTVSHQCRGLNEGDVEIKTAFGVDGLEFWVLTSWALAFVCVCHGTDLQRDGPQKRIVKWVRESYRP